MSSCKVRVYRAASRTVALLTVPLLSLAATAAPQSSRSNTPAAQLTARQDRAGARGRAQAQSQEIVTPQQQLTKQLNLQGAVRSGDGRRVLVRDDSGNQRVARVHVEVGDRLVLMLPDGRLDFAERSAVEPTERPFEPADVREMMQQLTAGPLKGFATRRTRRFLYVSNTSAEFYRGVRTILETMAPKVINYFRVRDFDVHEPEVPLVVVMFRTEREFQHYQPMPEGVLAYYDPVSNHVVMYEQSDLVHIAPELAFKQAVSTIAHEGVHQLLHNIGVQQRLSRWPMWLAEGLAEYFAPTDVRRGVRWKGVDQVNDLRMYELDQYLHQAGAGRGKIVRDTVGAEQLTSTGYATAWGLTHFLAIRKPEAFREYVRAASQWGPMEDHGAEGTKLFAKHFGSDDVKLEAALVEHWRGLEWLNPLEYQTHYVALLEYRRGNTIYRVAGVTTSPAAARQWHAQAQIGLTPAEKSTARFSCQAFAQRTVAERFASAWLNR